MNVSRIYIGTNPTDEFDFHLYPGQNLYTGEKPFIEHFGVINSLEQDLLNLASGVYGVDLVIHRNEREHFIRTFDVHIEVVNYHAFELIKNEIEKALYIVSRDNWNITFIQKDGDITQKIEWNDNEGAVLLFSGGLDSMSAASKFIQDQENLVLVSHNTQGNRVVDEHQRNVHDLLEKFYDTTIKHFHIKVYGRKHREYEFPEDRENTQRTRSFLFLSLATLVTRRVGFKKVLYMAENGQFAIHLPLNQSRVGPFSTHTADPEFVDTFRSLVRNLFNNSDFDLINPFLYMTKGEVFATLPPELQKQAHLSGSCWMISRIQKHCGYCIPCISRRIAIEHNSLSFDEYQENIFDTDLNKLSDTDDRKRNIIDYLEFISKFKNITPANRTSVLIEFPELFNDSINTDEALKMYERVSQQSYDVFKNYPRIEKLL
ncbi:MAG: 7-cyano-7-deazaguanine synthase [Balneola sp.]